jgi:UDP-N-acetylglucosamine 1-carboxyvinyltransferase
VIDGAAREPEIVDLGRFLVALGARIDGLGTSTIEIDGVESLGSAEHTLIPDRIEAVTLLLAGAITGGSVTVEGVEPTHMASVLEVLDRAGATISQNRNCVTLDARRRLRAFEVDARPHPGVPTDVQAQLMALATIAVGTSTITDHVFPERFAHVAELRRLGAHIVRSRNAATINDVAELTGAPVVASDLRASAALVLAGLAARGRTVISRVHHLERGYEQFDAKLRSLGASIQKRSALHRHRQPARSASEG